MAAKLLLAVSLGKSHGQGCPQVGDIWGWALQPCWGELLQTQMGTICFKKWEFVPLPLLQICLCSAGSMRPDMGALAWLGNLI